MAKKGKKRNRSRSRADIGVIPATAITQLASDYGWGRAIKKGMSGQATDMIGEVRIPGGIPGLMGDCIEIGIASSIYKATPKFKVNILGFKLHT